MADAKKDGDEWMEYRAKPLTGGLDSFLALVLTFIIVHYLFWFPAFVVATYALYLWLGTPVLIGASVLVAAYLVTFFDGSHLRAHGRESAWVRTHPLWDYIHRYTDLKLIRTAKLDPEQNYVFGTHPHGILVLNRTAFYGGVFDRMFPGINIRTLGATPMFFWPLCRDISLALGGVDAGRHIADKVLNAKLSLMVYPGGSEEIFLTEPNSTETRLVVNKRFGFIKLAMRHGTPLVPVAVFNERDAYHKLSAPESVRSWFLQTLKVPLLVFWGRFFTLLPFHFQMGVVIGKPIPVVKNEHPTDAEVAALHATYVKELDTLWHENKSNFGYGPEEELVIQ